MRGLRLLLSISKGAFESNGTLRRALIWGACAGILAGIVTHFLPRTYLSTAKILPASSSAGGIGGDLLNASGLSSIVGSALGNADAATLTYPEILVSEPLLVETLYEATPSNSSGRGRSVLAALKVPGKDSRERLYRGIKLLVSELKISANPRSGLIDVGIATRDSVLSAFIISTLLEKLNEFNVITRASQSKATRIFIEGRREQAERDLAAAENALTRFQEANMRIGNSPALLIEQSRLQREVSMRAEVFRLLSTQYELAGIEEYRDTPTFTVIEPPTPAFRKYRPSGLINVLSAACAAAAFAILFGFIERRSEIGIPDNMKSKSSLEDA